MSGAPSRLKLLLRLRLLEVDASRRATMRRGKERAVAASDHETAAARRGAACQIETEALMARNAHPGDAAFLLHSRACAEQSERAEALLIESRTREAEAEEAVRRARRELLQAETRCDGVYARIRAELARTRRRTERRDEDEAGGQPAMTRILAR